MNIQSFNTIVKERNFEEFPFYLSDDFIHPLVSYLETDIELKIHLAKLVLKRSFYGTYVAWHQDVDWFITNFFNDYERDCIKPDLSDAIKEAAQMITSKEYFTKTIIGTSFMFGILEFYAKYNLGFRPLQYNFNDKAKHNYAKALAPKQKTDLSIWSAFNLLQKQDLPISSSLNEIDTFTTQSLQEKGIEESTRKGIKYKIADRLAMARNPMLHGERHSFYDKGTYLLMLYILFHLHESEIIVNNTASKI